MSRLSLKTPVFAVAALAFLAGCATYRPILDENAKYEKVGHAKAERDIDYCEARADSYLKGHKSEKIKKEAGRGAATGAIVGGIAGLLSGGGLKSTAIGAGVGAGVGAAGGAGSEAAKGNLSPDEVRQRYITRCLQKKGYDIIGWK